MSAIFLNKYIIEFPNCPKTEREIKMKYPRKKISFKHDFI